MFLQTILHVIVTEVVPGFPLAQISTVGLLSATAFVWFDAAHFGAVPALVGLCMGSLAFFVPTRVQREDHHRSLPVAMRQLIVDLKAEYPDFSASTLETVWRGNVGSPSCSHLVTWERAHGRIPRHSTGSQYTMRYQPDHKHFTAVPEARRFETPYRSLQGQLWKLDETLWQRAFRLPDYAPRKKRRDEPQPTQLSLLEESSEARDPPALW